MVSKFVFLVVLASTAAFAAGNPAAGVEWRWTPRHATVSPNVNALPFAKLIETFTPTVRIPGTKSVEGCGQTRAGNTRIVGGQEASPHSYPHQVALFVDDMYFCGGSIISEDWVLTAAHCMDGARSVEIVAGAHNIQIYEASQVSQYSTNFFVHENWGSYTLKNDLALIKVSTPFTWTSAISPVCLPSYSSQDLPAGTLVNPSGWGKNSDQSGGISDKLREVTVPVDSLADCQRYYGPTTVTEDLICIKTTGGKGTCNGDSGGPLNHVEGGRTYTRGITSFGSSTGCETGYPDGFTRVSHYLDWIETNTGIMIDA